MQATGLNRETLLREFPFLAEVGAEDRKQPWIDRLDVRDDVAIKLVDDALMETTLFAHGGGGSLGESWDNKVGSAVLGDGRVKTLIAETSYRPSSGEETSEGADNIGTQVAGLGVAYVVVYTSRNRGTWDDCPTERGLTIYKRGSYDLAAWARRARQDSLRQLHAEMAMANSEDKTPLGGVSRES